MAVCATFLVSARTLSTLPFLLGGKERLHFFGEIAIPLLHLPKFVLPARASRRPELVENVGIRSEAVVLVSDRVSGSSLAAKRCRWCLA